MKTVKIYIETTITGPAAPKRGGYAAALTFTRRNGDIEDRFLKGEEEGTTYNRSVLLAMIYALQKLKEPCRVVFYTRNTYIKNMILADNPEKWRRAEWKKSDGKGMGFELRYCPVNVSEIPNPKVVASTFFSNLPFN